MAGQCRVQPEQWHRTTLRIKLRGLCGRAFVAGVQVVRSDQARKSSINVVRLSCRSMRLQFRSFTDGIFRSAGAARRFASLVCLAAKAMAAAGLCQSREILGEGDSVRITV